MMSCLWHCYVDVQKKNWILTSTIVLQIVLRNSTVSLERLSSLRKLLKLLLGQVTLQVNKTTSVSPDSLIFCHCLNE